MKTYGVVARAGWVRPKAKLEIGFEALNILGLDQGLPKAESSLGSSDNDP